MSSSFNYREFAPGPALSDAVECFWTGTTDRSATPSPHRILPDGCMDILFDFRATTTARACVVGTTNRSFTFTSAGPLDFLGVRFCPGGLTSLIAVDAAELTNQRADLSNFWGAAAETLWHRLAEAAPAARIADLERSTGLSSRQLERKFAQWVGISPKTFARIIRFKRVVAAAEASPAPPDWARLAAEFNFADQPHLVREFKEFSDLSPVAFMVDSDAPCADVGFLQDARV